MINKTADSIINKFDKHAVRNINITNFFTQKYPERDEQRKIEVQQPMHFTKVHTKIQSQTPLKKESMDIILQSTAYNLNRTLTVRVNDHRTDYMTQLMQM